MRLLIVSNRLPVSINKENGKLKFEKSAGGLVSGLTDFLNNLEKSDSYIDDYIWMGWPGSTIEKEKEDTIRKKVQNDYKASPVFLSEELMDKVYLGFCNKTIWPLFHYFPGYANFDNQHWAEYKKMNQIFCDEILKVIEPGDVVWIHDYHLMLLPAMLREKIDNPIGFFLHIPFPSYEMYRLFPKESKNSILEGLLGADLIGFHTHDYVQYFLRSVIRILGIDNHMGNIEFPDRIVKAGTFPMGIEFDKFNKMRVSPHPSKKPGPYEAKIILSADRLDYTKGIINRLQGFELFLEKYPEWHEKVVLNMIVVPSRTGVNTYQEIKQKLDELVGNINGNYSTMDWVPINYQFTSLPHKQLIAQYRMSDVSLITPLRDGMNLIAKEYIASLRDQKGVLVLSELTGAAKELGESIVINPNNIEEIADGINEALNTPRKEQLRRNRIMQNRLKRYNVVKWANDFTDTLLETSRISAFTSSKKLVNKEVLDNIIKHYKESKNRLIIANYDGTLVPHTRESDDAVPSKDLIKTLKNIKKSGKNDIVIISGRSKEQLGKWLRSAPVNLTAEHGVWIKEMGVGKWELFKPLSNEWKENVLPVLEMHTDRLPGSYIEEKEYSVSWHYQKADVLQASFLSKEVYDYLYSSVSNIGLQVLQGEKVIEVSNAGVNKGELAMHWLSQKDYDFILAIGSGWSDEMLFQTMPKHAWTIGIDLLQTDAKFVMRKQKSVIELLEKLKDN